MLCQWGYDSSVVQLFGPAGKGNINDHSKQLLRDLSVRLHSQFRDLCKPDELKELTFVGIQGMRVPISSDTKHASSPKESTSAYHNRTLLLLNPSNRYYLFRNHHH